VEDIDNRVSVLLVDVRNRYIERLRSNEHVGALIEFDRIEWAEPDGVPSAPAGSLAEVVVANFAVAQVQCDMQRAALVDQHDHLREVVRVETEAEQMLGPVEVKEHHFQENTASHKCQGRQIEVSRSVANRFRVKATQRNGDVTYSEWTESTAIQAVLDRQVVRGPREKRKTMKGLEIAGSAALSFAVTFASGGTMTAAATTALGAAVASAREGGARVQYQGKLPSSSSSGSSSSTATRSTSTSTTAHTPAPASDAPTSSPQSKPTPEPGTRPSGSIGNGSAGDVWLYRSDGSFISEAIVGAQSLVHGVAPVCVPYSHASIDLGNGRHLTATGAAGAGGQVPEEDILFNRNGNSARQIDVFRHTDAARDRGGALRGHAENLTVEPYMLTGRWCSKEVATALQSAGFAVDESVRAARVVTPADLATDSHLRPVGSLDTAAGMCLPAPAPSAAQQSHCPLPFPHR